MSKKPSGLRPVLALITLASFFFVFLGQISVIAAPKIKNDTSASETPSTTPETLEQALADFKEHQNQITYSKVKMLERKTGQTSTSRNGQLTVPGDQSPLILDLYGGFPVRQSEIVNGLDLLTGQRAIDESLQLGSIGQTRDPSNDQESAVVALADIKSLEIKSHPWEQMIAKLPNKQEIPAIFGLVPEDQFVVYFNDMTKFDELEQTLKSLADPVDGIFSLKQSAGLKAKILQRLGLAQFAELQPFIKEFTFLSQDLSFYPATNYALIFNFKSDVVETLLEKLDSSKNQRAQIGDYYVVATNQKILNDIRETFAKKLPSMRSAKDFKYAWNALENRRDGLIYFSEKFITKLVGPGYRLNAARRNSIIEALEALQYTVFAYRDLTGQWPKSLQQIADEDYIDLQAIKNPQNYSIDQNGKIAHKDWGSLYKLSAVADVPLDKITTAEKSRYDDFRDGYKSFWREFFDPIGVAITVGDQIMLHTLILPLIDESDYNNFKVVTGGEPIAFEFLKQSPRPQAVSLHGKVNIDAILFFFGREEAYREYRSEQRQNDTDRGNIIQEGEEELYKIMDKEEFYKTINHQEIINKVEKKIFEAIGWSDQKHIADMIGQEAMLGMGSKNTFKVENIANLDLYLGLKLKDPKLAQKFLDTVLEFLGKEFGDSSGESFGFFEVSGTKPIKNSYQNTDYYMIPTGFVNLYYTFIADNFYITISQLAMNQVIDGQKTEINISNEVKRGLDYVGLKHNVLLSADVAQIDAWKDSLQTSRTAYRAVEESLGATKIYLDEAITLAKTLPSFDDSLKSVDGLYYRNIPKTWLGFNIKIDDGQAIIVAGDTTYKLNELPAAGRYGQESAKVFKKLFDSVDRQAMLKSWESIKNLTLGFSFTEDGIATRLAFNNSANSTMDERFSADEQNDVDSFFSKYKILLAGGVIVAIGLLLIILKIKRRSNPLPPPSDDRPVVV